MKVSNSFGEMELHQRTNGFVNDIDFVSHSQQTAAFPRRAEPCSGYSSLS
jgi:hypothetical protein